MSAAELACSGYAKKLREHAFDAPKYVVEAQGGRMQFVTDLHSLLGWSSLNREYALYGTPQ